MQVLAKRLRRGLRLGERSHTLLEPSTPTRVSTIPLHLQCHGRFRHFPELFPYPCLSTNPTVGNVMIRTGLNGTWHAVIGDFDRCVPLDRALGAGGGTKATTSPERLMGSVAYYREDDIFSAG